MSTMSTAFWMPRLMPGRKTRRKAYQLPAPEVAGGLEQALVELLRGGVDRQDREGQVRVHGDQEHRADVVQERGLGLHEAERDEEGLHRAVRVQERLPGEDAHEEARPEGDHHEQQDRAAPPLRRPRHGVRGGDGEQDADHGGRHAHPDRAPDDGGVVRVAERAQRLEGPPRADAAVGVGRAQRDRRRPAASARRRSTRARGRRAPSPPVRRRAPGSGRSRLARLRARPRTRASCRRRRARRARRPPPSGSASRRGRSARAAARPRSAAPRPAPGSACASRGRSRPRRCRGRGSPAAPSSGRSREMRIFSGRTTRETASPGAIRLSL